MQSRLSDARMAADQIIETARKEADTLRKAMGKKQADLMAKQKALFLDGCLKHGIPRAKALEIFARLGTPIEPDKVKETLAGLPEV